MKQTMLAIFTVLCIFFAGTFVLAETPAEVDKSLSPYFFVKSDNPEVDQLPLLFTSADVDIAGVIADVTVTQIYKNEGTRALEAIYVFPASTRAAVYGMTMTVGDRTIFAQIREREKARQEYEQAKQEGKTASLLEQQRPNVFQMNVANILPGDLIKVELKYTELLVPTDGVYEFVYPTVVGPRYSNQNTATASDTDTWVANPYHQEGEKPSYLFDISTHLSTGIPIQEIGCATHNVQVDYEGPLTAAITLDEVEMIEKVRLMKPEHRERLTDALKELYIGEDFGNLPAFYQKLFRIVTAPAQQQETLIERQVVQKFTGDRDYILKYRLAGNAIESGLLLYEGASSSEQEEENFFLLMVQPPKRVNLEHIPPREYIFVVDVSGSMHGFPLNISKELLRNLISGLRPTDTFNVLLFAGSSAVMADHSLAATGENINKAIGLIDKQAGGGGTRLLPALKRALLALPKTEGVSRTVVVVTDGYVHVETETFELIRNNLNHANMFAFGIGTSVNRFLIEGMGRIGQGEPFVITAEREAASKAAKFRQYIQSPVLTGITCQFDGFDAYDVEPLSIPDVLAERPVILFGKWRGKPEGVIRLSGYSGEGEYRQTFHVNGVPPSDTNSSLRYLWARKRIELLGDYNKLHPSDARVQEITNLGLTYNLLTAYTSFVAIDSEVRRKGNDLETVKQAVPLPQGVSNQAVGSSSYSGGGTVPEPGTMLLTGVGLAVLAWVALREKLHRQRDK
jgi:Ca-activated chloride channel family protein